MVARSAQEPTGAYTMNIQSVSLSQLVPSAFNPRKKFDAASIEGLAASIKTDGLLQNLVAQPLEGKGRKQTFGIISGERRYRALKLLDERGELPEGFTIPVEIRAELDEDDSLRLSTVENLQRANLAPLEEAAALTKLVHKGTTLEEVVAQTGLSASTIKRRLALNGLCKEAKKALRENTINLAQAEALTLGDHDRQRSILEDLAQGHGGYSAADIRDHLLDDRPTLADAIFPQEQYTGTITTDLFAESETSYFDDVEQFHELQRMAVEKLADEHREKAAWVEVTNAYNIPNWQYRPAKKKEKGGVLINLSPTGKVEVREGLVPHNIDKATRDETAENPLAERTKATYTAPLCRYIAHHKSAAVQEILLSNPRKAREVAAVKSLIALRPHACLTALAQEDDPQTAYKVLDAHARLHAQRLAITVEDDDLVWNQFPRPGYEDVDLYEAIKRLSDHELDELHTLLAALAFGQASCDKLDTGDSLFNRVAQDLAVDMKNHWKPDRSFLERRNTKQLVTVSKECGYAERVSLINKFKKSELVAGLGRYFTEGATDKGATSWLPEAMLFPAIDPDAKNSPESAESEEDGSEE
jgi:ParB family chromosome partitioning protein